MLRKNISELHGIDLSRLHQLATTYYSAHSALLALAEAQERFRAAVATGAFTHDRALPVLHELEELAESHESTTHVAFEAFQELAFAALERGMPAGFRGEFIELTARTASTVPPHERVYACFTYARLDIDMQRWTTPAAGNLTLYVSQNVARYGGPDESAGRPPSSCRAHSFRNDWTLPQAWTWQPAGL